jgi:phenylalanyl-tRNA synthetase beta subunit
LLLLAVVRESDTMCACVRVCERVRFRLGVAASREAVQGLGCTLTHPPAPHNTTQHQQDKLHQNLCRQRTLVAIGTHDLSKIEGPFTYEALPPSEIEFVPLKQTQSWRSDELMQHYLDNDRTNLGKFVPIIKDSIVYPVIYDANRTVLSLPPIINGAHSAISLDTKDVFIECTATDLTKAKVVLNTVCTMFAEYCDRPFEVEPVEVVNAFGKVWRTHRQHSCCAFVLLLLLLPCPACYCCCCCC